MDDIIPPTCDLALSEMLDRALNKGVVVIGDITISIADVDLIYLGLKILLSSVETAQRLRPPRESPLPPRHTKLAPEACCGSTDTTEIGSEHALSLRSH
jgi:gas vesicle structural protein